jgi:23S rRNA (cytosine1962-C5)-methyltransferase
VAEEGMAFEVEPRLGQKTGHYADQRENRRHVAELAAGAGVLDLYAGSGGFSVQALRHGARTALAVESSARAAAAARRTGTLNATGGRLEVQEADAREVLEGLKAAGRLFDVVVLDPPNFFPRHGGPGRALRAHRDLNVQALTRVGPGGILATFTCSAALPPAGFRELVLSAARECRRTLRVLRELAAGPDHPVLAAAPEGRYLTGLLAAVDA